MECPGVSEGLKRIYSTEGTGPGLQSLDWEKRNKDRTTVMGDHPNREW